MTLSRTPQLPGLPLGQCSNRHLDGGTFTRRNPARFDPLTHPQAVGCQIPKAPSNVIGVAS